MIEKATYDRVNKVTGEAEEVDTFTGEVVSRTKMYTTMDEELAKYELTPGIIFQVARLLMEGKTLTHISKMEGMPPRSVLNNWCARSDDFKTMVEESEKSRADIFHTKIIDSVDSLPELEKDEVGAMKLYIDTLFRLSEADNPEKFKPKGGSQEGGGVVSITVNTGIDRTPEKGDNIVDANFKEVNHGGSEAKEESD